jgi:ComF family protein
VGAIPAAVVRGFQSLHGRVVDLLFPPRCVVCQRLGSWLCAACQREMPRVMPPVCARCGDPLPDHGMCARCRSSPLRIDGIRSVYCFDGAAREAIHRLKYDGLAALAIPLGAALADAWREQPCAADVVVPVPLHRRRQAERGFNQSALLAREFARRLALPLDETALSRQRATRPQVDLGAEERKENVRGAFVATGRALSGKSVLLIDDVCTTGATLEACAVAMYAGGARRVCALTLARAH